MFGDLDELKAKATGGPAAAIMLVEAWRALLELHETTASGACRACGPRWRRRMCSVWRVAVAYFVRHERGAGGS
ncbi:hypothetical protein BBK82_18130 [Lentzea guizhouensis]|uniref:Uncharacterized protein n=1 Tax=Lentzea guizhouensis TaxID=1586287 RepID=A0A1B2HIZ5_9PSEU|nr:hypothetical protein BBK82_18130 [Lentzea guizhouensis]